MAATPPNLAPPPPPAPPPLSTLTEKASQLAGQISNQTQFEAALNSVGGGALPAPQKGQLWDTVNKTRVGQGLPPLSVAPPAPAGPTIAAPGSPPGGTPVVGGQTPVPPAVTAALPASVTGSASPQTSPAPAQAGSQPVPPPGLKRPDDVPQLQAPPQPTATYKAPDLATATYNAPKYEPPKKGLLYAAAALALLFPGSQIGRAAGAFAQGLNTGAQQKYAREEQTAKDTYESDKAKDATINQGRIAQADANLTRDQAYDKWVAQKTTVGNENADRVYTARQEERKQGRDPDTHKPFVPPGGLSKPPPPAIGYDGLAKWHQARALWFSQQGALGPAKDEADFAKEATTQAVNAANNARQLKEAADRARETWAIHQDTERNENNRHDDTVWNENQRALLVDSGRRAEYGVRASAADKSLFGTWQKALVAPTKTETVKDVNGTVVAEHTVPMVDDKGQVIPAPISGALKDTLTKMVNLVRNDRDPEGAAAYYSAHLGNDPGGLAGQEILQQAGEAGSLRLMAGGRMPQEHAWPKISGAPAPDPFKAAGINANDPAVKAQIDAAHDAGVTDDGTIITTLKQHGFGGTPGKTPAVVTPPPHLSRADRTIAAQAAAAAALQAGPRKTPGTQPQPTPGP